MDQGLVLYFISVLFLKGCEQEKTSVWLTQCTCLQGRAYAHMLWRSDNECAAGGGLDALHKSTPEGDAV
jgi:hypothetical protein